MKEIMDGYVGVKFESILLNPKVPFDIEEIFAVFQKNCNLLKQHGMTPKNAGNISIRHNKGFIITTSGSNLGTLERNEIVYVRKCSGNEGLVEYMGPTIPSSEAFMHSRIYQCSTDVQAIVHAHDHETLQQATAELEATEREAPYGTLELAALACDTFRKAKDIIVLKNHGYVAVGGNLNEAVDLVISTHLKIKKKGVDYTAPQ